MNNQMFDPRAMQLVLEQMKQIQRENEQSLRRMFDSKIKQNFLTYFDNCLLTKKSNVIY